jgi:putative oxidoreductase
LYLLQFNSSAISEGLKQHLEETHMLNGIIPASWSGPLHAALRIMTGLLLLQHGLTKFVHWPATEYFPADQALPPLMMVAGALELVGGTLIILGLFTRVTAFVLAGFAAAAYFMAHMPNSFFPIQNGGEFAIMLCFVFLYFAAAGAGPYSVDESRT